MDIESFVSMLLKSMRKTGLPIAEVEQLHENKWLFGIEMSDKSEFLLKIGKRDTEQEAYLMGLDETNSKIHDIYERYTNSWEFNETLMHNDFNITWLLEELDYENYRKIIFCVIVPEMMNFYSDLDLNMHGLCFMNV